MKNVPNTGNPFFQDQFPLDHHRCCPGIVVILDNIPLIGKIAIKGKVYYRRVKVGQGKCLPATL